MPSKLVYLINCLPTPTLQFKLLFTCLFHTSPNYSKLQVFGYLCYLLLRPYTCHKLESHSKPRVFIGYSNIHNAYKCFDVQSNKVFIFRHVIFVKEHFLFLSSSTSRHDFEINNFIAWTSALLSLSHLASKIDVSKS